MLLKKSNDQNSMVILYDLAVFGLFSILSLHAPLPSSLLVLLYFVLRIVFSKAENTLYLILLFSANTNVFFVFGAPVCNLVIVASLIRLFFIKKMTKFNVIGIGIIICVFEIFHWFIYDYFNIFQSLIWILAFIYPIFYFATCRKLYDNNKAKLYFFASIICSLIYGIYYRAYSGIGFSIDTFTLDDSYRFGGGFYDPNYFSMFCVILLALIIAKYLNGKSNGRYFEKLPGWLFGVVSMFLIFFCIVGMSRMFIITFGIMSVLFLPKLLFFSKESRRLVFALLFLAIALFFIIKYSSFDFLTLFNNVLDRFNVSNNISELTSGRSDLISNAMSYLNENVDALLFGVGIQSYYMRIGGGYLHCWPIEVLVSLGIVGTLVYIVFYVMLFVTIGKYYNKTKKERLINKYINIIPLCLFLICSLSLNVMEVEIFYSVILMLMMNAKYVENSEVLE